MTIYIPLSHYITAHTTHHPLTLTVIRMIECVEQLTPSASLDWQAVYECLHSLPR
jgi:hypothetical protein